MNVGFRYAVGWSLRRARTWIAVGAAALATWLASRDHRTGWTIVVGVTTGTFALLAIWGAYADAHPDRPERLAARQQARVAAILARHDGVDVPAPARHRARPRRAERRAARHQARIDAILARHDRAAGNGSAHQDGDPSYTP